MSAVLVLCSRRSKLGRRLSLYTSFAALITASFACSSSSGDQGGFITVTTITAGASGARASSSSSSRTRTASAGNGGTGIAGSAGASGSPNVGNGDGIGGKSGAGGATSGAGGRTAGASGAAGATAGAGGATATSAPASRGVLMRGYDLKRTGANLNETILTKSVVTPSSFGKLGCYPVEGHIYAQMLYVASLDFGATGKHDVLVIATMKNHVYVVDASDPSKVYWHNTYGAAAPTRSVIPEANAKCNPYGDIEQWIGILGSPAIDIETSTLYFVARTNDDGQTKQRLYAVNLSDGTNRAGSPVEINAIYNGTGDPGDAPEEPDVVTDGHFSFNPRRHNQRMALTLYDGIVYIGWAAFCDWRPFHGWLIGYDAKTLAQRVVFNTTPNGHSGGIWMAGAGPAIDDDGTMYLATGNGSADLQGGPNRGESFVKLRRDGGTMKVLDWFTPYEYQFLEDDDRDIGAAGVLLVPGTNWLVGGGKQAKIYVTDKTNLGKWTAPTTEYVTKKENGGKVGLPPAGSDNIVQTLEVASMSTPPNAHNHSTPAYWKSDAGEFIYTMAEEDNLRQWRIQNGRFELHKTSAVRAPDDQSEGGFPNPSGYTMPGGSMVLSANGARSDSGILWITLPISRDANEASVPGLMYAFDAADVSKLLWSSQANPDRDAVGNYAKFNPVTVYNGKVFVPTFDDANAANEFCVYGRL